MDIDISKLSTLIEEDIVVQQENDIYSDEVSLKLKETYNGEGYFDPVDEYAPKGSLWNNPTINKIKKNMSDAQLKYFESQGDMYNTDFSKSDIDNDLKEMIEYVKIGLNSGLNPKDLSDDEKDAMAEIYGPTWYILYGFNEEDVYDD